LDGGVFDKIYNRCLSKLTTIQNVENPFYPKLTTSQITPFTVIKYSNNGFQLMML